MIQIMNGIGKGLKLSIVFALIGLAAWGGYKGMRHAFIDNEKYKLQEIKLQTNGHLDHQRVVEVAGINLNDSIFAVNAEDARKRLNALPEVIDSSVNRRLPGTLKIKITERVPVVWLECDQLGYPGRKDGGILADKDGITFPCEGALWQTARDLPVIVLKESTVDDFELGKPMQHRDAMRALRLIQRFSNTGIRNDWLPERVILVNNYSMDAVCNDGTRATFGMYEHERQMRDFIKISEHTRKTQRNIQHINLIPKKNIPVRFAATPQLVQPNTP